MRAMIVGDNGLELREMPTPTPGPGQVLVRVRAGGLNRAELAVAAGHAHGAIGGTGSPIGLEWAGEVAAVGPDVPDLREGDRVMCSGNGGYAEYAMTDWGRVSKLPDSNLSWEQAATLPIALATMHNAAITVGELKLGQSVLFQGASSGVGLMGMQIAREMGAGLVLGSSTNAARLAKLPEFGADQAIDTSDPAWPDAVLTATEGRGVDLIVDMVSRPRRRRQPEGDAHPGPDRQCRAPRWSDRHVRLRPACRPPHLLYRRHLPHPQRGGGAGDQSPDEGRSVGRAASRSAATADRPQLTRLEQAVEAQAHMRSNGHFGKIVLTVD